MQLDMHYYGTFAMARAAGLTREAAERVATAAQFVDDNADKESVCFRDGARMDVEATAHHALDRKNIDLEDQRKIWVPFHFLPGNEGDSYTDRLVCRQKSTIAKEMVDFNLSLINQDYGLPLLGVTAHVLADTFSHYGFSGVSSRRNRVDNDSFDFKNTTPEISDYLKQREEEFDENYSNEKGLLANVKSWFAETLSGALGHGAVMTYPDRPFLVWTFVYEGSDAPCPPRDNPATFLEGCEALHTIFRRAAEARPEIYEGTHKEFADIREKVLEILRAQAPKEGRIKAWQEAAKSGDLFATGGEEIPDYDQDDWHNQRDNLRRRRDSSVVPDLPVYRFYQAAAVHRTNVLRHLLPRHGLVVS